MSTSSNRVRTMLGRLRRAGAAAVREARAQIPSADGAPPDLTNPSAMFAWLRARGDVTRPNYLWPTLLAAKTARGLGYESISVIEFGVAGGNGLLALEAAAARAEELLGVKIEVYGFDTGTGMPPPVDYRDVPWVIQPGIFAMDEAALRARLTRAELVLGPVAGTVGMWLERNLAPIGFISFDLDYYSSTIQAFSILEADASRTLPRVACYFDDIFGYGWSDFNGERVAITDFNRTHESRKIGAIYGLRYELPPAEFRRAWPDQMYLVHVLDHHRYNDFEGDMSEAWFRAHRLQDHPAPTG